MYKQHFDGLFGGSDNGNLQQTAKKSLIALDLHLDPAVVNTSSQHSPAGQ